MSLHVYVCVYYCHVSIADCLCVFLYMSMPFSMNVKRTLILKTSYIDEHARHCSVHVYYGSECYSGHRVYDWYWPRVKVWCLEETLCLIQLFSLPLDASLFHSNVAAEDC